MAIKVGDEFRLFKRGRVYKVTAITNARIKFQAVDGILMVGSIPLDQVSEHFRSSRR